MAATHDDFLTLAVRVHGRRCLVVGAGDAGGGRKARRLVAHGAVVTVVAPAAGAVISGLAAAGRLDYFPRQYDENDLAEVWLVVAATDDHQLNEAIVAQARARGVLTSLASRGVGGDVLFTATTRHGPSTVAVHSAGSGVRRTLALRDRVAGFLAGLPDELAPPALGPGASGGMVYLVGAGPGAADLLTLRALRVLQRCQVLIVDRILGRQFLDELDLDLRHVEVWHLSGGTNSPARQQEINRRLVAEAQSGKRVARLKAGDPLVFGRGGEEAEACDAAGVRWEFVPGLSASVALLTNAGYPATDRGRGRSFAVVSARLAGGAANERMPRAESLIVLMGFQVLDDVRQRLYADGWSTDTPAVLIERGTAPWERRVAAPLDQVLEQAAALGCASPVILALGAAAARHYRSAQRPVVVFTGRHVGPWRDLGDCLHWPAACLADLPPGARVPPHQVIAFVTPADVAAWASHWGAAALAPAAAVWVADSVTAAAAQAQWPDRELVLVAAG